MWHLSANLEILNLEGKKWEGILPDFSSYFKNH